jgi:hypothetical protein
MASGSVPHQRSGQGLLSSQGKLGFVTVNESSSSDDYDSCDDANAERSRPANLARPLSEIVRPESIEECPNHSPSGIKECAQLMQFVPARNAANERSTATKRPKNTTAPP